MAGLGIQELIILGIIGLVVVVLPIIALAVILSNYRNKDRKQDD
jgi:hypothetical protein